MRKYLLPARLEPCLLAAGHKDSPAGWPLVPAVGSPRGDHYGKDSSQYYRHSTD
jgi:hypothetical protein